MAGLRMTRKYRHWTYGFRLFSRVVLKVTIDPVELFAVTVGLVKRPQKTLLWTKTHTTNASHLEYPPTIPAYAPHHRVNPSIELSDYSSVAMERDDSQQMHDTPAMAHSLFPPALPRRRPHRDSDSSQPMPSSPIFASIGNETSISPLIRRPMETLHYRERADFAVVDDEHRSSGEDMLSPTLLHEETSLINPLLASGPGLQSRQRYERANSDSAQHSATQGLGISMQDLSAGSDLERGLDRR